jgi:hypothetical protein
MIVSRIIQVPFVMVYTKVKVPAVDNPDTVVDADVGVAIVAELVVVHNAVPGAGEFPVRATEPVVAQIC